MANPAQRKFGLWIPSEDKGPDVINLSPFNWKQMPFCFTKGHAVFKKKRKQTAQTVLPAQKVEGKRAIVVSYTVKIRQKVIRKEASLERLGAFKTSISIWFWARSRLKGSLQVAGV